MVVLSVVAVLAVAFSTISAAPTAHDNAAQAALDQVKPDAAAKKEMAEALKNHAELVGPLVEIGEVFTKAHGNVDKGVTEMLTVMQKYGKVVPAIIALSEQLVKNNGGVKELHANLQLVAQALKEHENDIPEWATEGQEVGPEQMAEKLADHKYAAVLPAVIALSMALVKSPGHENLHSELQTVATALKEHEKVIPGLAAVGVGFTSEGVSVEQMQTKLGALGKALKEHQAVLPTLAALGAAMKKAHATPDEPQAMQESYKALAQLLAKN